MQVFLVPKTPEDTVEYRGRITSLTFWELSPENSVVCRVALQTRTETQAMAKSRKEITCKCIQNELASLAQDVQVCRSSTVPEKVTAIARKACSTILCRHTVLPGASSLPGAGLGKLAQGYHLSLWRAIRLRYQVMRFILTG